jgi:hypothetical protein
MKYFIQTATVVESDNTSTHSIVTNGEGRELLNEIHGNWCQMEPDASGSPKMEISRGEYEALHKKLFPYSSCNVREEFEEMSSFGTVICAEIIHFPRKDNETRLCLKSKFNKEEYESFLDLLDFLYDNGYGQTFISGTIWFQDGTWATCEEYDGSEYWEHHKASEIPEHLR